MTRLIEQLNVDKLENPYRDTPRIGMGLKSGYKPHRVSRNEVLVDVFLGTLPGGTPETVLVPFGIDFP